MKISIKTKNKQPKLGTVRTFAHGVPFNIVMPNGQKHLCIKVKGAYGGSVLWFPELGTTTAMRVYVPKTRQYYETCVAEPLPSGTMVSFTV